ncbi:MAG: hypothetical protein M1825_006117 [Sarcosagium campestre]|nr:MAG: hypothetical protein M1825_006117 [Sarcosagium campestre]
MGQSSRRGSVFAHILGRYVPSTQVRNVLVLSTREYGATLPVVWNVVKITLDSFWRLANGQPHRGRAKFAKFVSGFRALRSRGGFDRTWTQEVNIVGDPHRPREPGVQLAEELITSGQHAIIDFIEELEAMDIFTRVSPRPPGVRTAANQKQLDEYPNSTVDKPVANPRKQEDDSELPAASVRRSCEISEEQRFHLLETRSETDVTLSDVDYESATSLSRILKDHIPQVRELRLYGEIDETRFQENPYPQRMTRGREQLAAADMLDSCRCLKIQRLKLVYLADEVLPIMRHINASFLWDLDIEYCVRFFNIFGPLVRKARNLVNFRLIAPQDVDWIPDHEMKMQLLDHRYMTDFLRSRTARLRYLEVLGVFDRDRLFAGIQAHFPTLENLIALNGDTDEFTRWQMLEMGKCCPRLRDLRIRAGSYEEAFENTGLITFLPEILPEFKSLKAFCFMRSIAASTAESEELHYTAMGAVMAGTVRVGLVFVGYDEVNDEGEVEWIYHIHRRTGLWDSDDNRELELVSRRPDRDFDDVMNDFNRTALALGIPQRKFAVPIPGGFRPD